MSAIAERVLGSRPSGAKPTSTVVIVPWRKGVFARLEEIWRYRALFPHFAKELIMRRYRKTYLGWFWIPLRPGLQIASGGLVFGAFLSVKSGDRPYVLYLALSTAGWVLFERAFHWGTRAVRMASSFSGGAHFPRIMVVAASAGPAVVDFMINSLVFLIALGYLTFAKGQNYLAPVQQMVSGVAGLALLLLFGLAISLITGPLTAITKEVRYVTAYAVQFLLFITPVYYPISELPDRYKPIIQMNPLTAPLELVQFGFVGAGAPSATSLLACLIGLTVVVVGGIMFFNRFERAFVARL
jgi:lipopolysaccharide transport system permease protein